MKPGKITPADAYRVLLQREIEFSESSPQYRSLNTMDPREMCRVIMGSEEFRKLWGIGTAMLPDLVVMTDAPGLRYWVRLRDKWQGQEIARNRYEPGVTAAVKRAVRPGMTVLDIGANIGYFTVILGAAGCRVHAFEPFPANFRLLERNIAENHLSNVTPHCVVVHRETKTGKLFYGTGDRVEHFGTMFSSAMEQPGHLTSMEVPYVALDDYLHDVSDVGFVKMDVEGAEIFALQGMRRLIERWRPVMVLELNEQALLQANGHTAEQLLVQLREFGYRLVDVENGEPFVLPEKREEFCLANLLCEPV